MSFYFPIPAFAFCCAVLMVTIGLPSSFAKETSPPVVQSKAKKSKPQQALAEVSEVKLNRKRGFYDAPFDLSFTTKTEGAVIRYTTDGSEPTLKQGMTYQTPLKIAKTSFLRVAAFKAGFTASKIKTHTFLFLRDVLMQSPDGLPPEGFPYLWGKNQVDYGMDPRIVNDPRYREEILTGLKALPSFSLVTDVDSLFGKKRGVYSNPGEQGWESERSCSLEMLPTDGGKDFQINCGIRIRGGFSRMPINVKHAFRLFFRDDYGEGKLKYPLFGKDGAQKFENLDLRTFQNYSWSLSGDSRGVFLRDQFNRDLQLAMGQPAARGEFCHLYLNGQYWGIYNTCERPEASFGATYFGGRKADYDVVKVDSGFTTRGSTYTLIATDGNLDAWHRLYKSASTGLKNNAVYFALQGRHPDGSPDQASENLLDVDNLIDYMLIIFWGGNLDAPISAFGDNRNPNNYHSLHPKNGSRGFQFLIWDAEHTLLNVEEDRTGPFKTGETMKTSSPQWLWQQCVENAEFRIRIADRVQSHFFNEGVLSPESVGRRFTARARQIESAVIAESARWGDVKHTVKQGTPLRFDPNGNLLTGPFNRDDDWRPEINRLVKNYLPNRSDIVLSQLFAQGLLPDIDPPQLVPQNAAVASKLTLTSGTPKASIHYTVDGTDPRLVGGEISAKALKYSEPIPADIDRSTIKARARIDGDWSALSTFQRIVQ
ncbi:MAG: hypothetical protein EXS25_04755 [Pedosphaera sp.]|nr:hypothetical protein [Pedosphaera sp.]